jgi:hypothetical protein
VIAKSRRVRGAWINHHTPRGVFRSRSKLFRRIPRDRLASEGAQVWETRRQRSITRLRIFGSGTHRWTCSSCFVLGLRHRKGVSVPKNDGKALEYLKKACDGGDKMGCEQLSKSPAH